MNEVGIIQDVRVMDNELYSFYFIFYLFLF